MVEEFGAFIKILGHKCYRCRHIWLPRQYEIAKVCPNCKSPYWNKPKSRGVKDE